MNKIDITGLSGFLTRFLVAFLLVGECQQNVVALNRVSQADKLGVNVENVRLKKNPSLNRKQSNKVQGIADTFFCNMIPESDYSEYGGFYINDDYVWRWEYGDIQTFEAEQTILTYDQDKSFGFKRVNGAPAIEAVKLYLDPKRTNNASLSACLVSSDGSLYYTDTEIVADYENDIVYWYPDSEYQEDNIYFYVESGELSMVGFEIYSEGNTPKDFKTTYMPSVEPPVFKPSSCNFSDPLTIGISAKEGCDIFYSTDGYLVPGGGNEYNGPVVISSTTTFKAMAIDRDGNSSLISTAAYTSLRHGIGEGYDPKSPGNPESGVDEEPTYHLTIVANPVDAGSVSSNYYDTFEGQEVRLKASPNSGFSFVNWTIEGKEVSNESSFYYVMPAYDVTIVANYKYNPNNPGNPSPEEQKVKHPVVVRTIPSGCASLSPSGAFDMEENASRQIYAYPNSGWQLIGWEINGERVPTTTSPIQVTMGEKALDIVAYLTYNPTSPSNPGANYYNTTTGEVIIDDFAPGNLYGALNALVGSNNFSNISSLIVKGEVTSNDLGNLSNLSNAGTIDISRTGGVSTLPGYTFSSVRASSIVLPSTISSLANYVFNKCESLTSITIYAQEPPTCNRNAFSGFTNKDNCIVYVPQAALELYVNADYWKDFTILPITSDAHVLQVNLPDDASDGRYKNNSLEIVNVNSGVRQKYVVSDRLLYTFNGLQKDEQYNIYMFSQAGLEIGRIENVTIPDRDVEVTFDDLKKLYTVFAKVTTPDGKEVTSDVTVEWLKPLADGTTTYLRKTKSLGEIPEGQALLCRVTLNDQLGTVYAMPDDTEFTVSKDHNTCMVNLVPFRSIALSGTVVDGDGAVLSGASVSVNQTLNGKYSKSYTAKTDRQGKWALSVLDAPETRLTYAATECVNVNDTIGAFEPETSTLDLGKTTMKSIVGARVTYGFTYHAAGSEDVQDYYSDYQNVLVSVFNVTQNRTLDDVSLQYPILAVLDENINTGDELRLTATSKTGAFNPIVETVKVGENQRAEVTFDIVGKGGIAASFEMTDNPAVVAMLYSSKGEFLKKQTYSEAQTTFTGLEDGDYILVSMGLYNMMNSILRLSNFSEIGLTEGKDYIKNAAKVESGKLSEIKNSEIPTFDESLFFYTNSSTSFSSNKSSVTTGNYLTLRSAIDFKGVYKNDISNVMLVVDLPEACEFVEQSVIQGSNLLPYTLDNNRLIVPLGNNYQNIVRFCVVPTNGGELNATATVAFDFKGKTMKQPIGSAVSKVEDLGITLPSVWASNEFKVTGTGTPNSVVNVYANNTLVGTGVVGLSGYWNVPCSLDNPYNLSSYDIYAEIVTEKNGTLQTETRKLTYDINAIGVYKVTLLVDGQTIEWNFQNPENKELFFQCTNPQVYTFTVSFTNNDPEKISNVIVWAERTDGVQDPIPAHYNEEKGLWVASTKYDPAGLGPVNVSIDFDYNAEPMIDSEEYNNSINSVIISRENIESTISELDRIESELEDYYAGISTDADVDELLRESRIISGAGAQLSTDDLDELTEEEAQVYFEQLAAEVNNQLVNGSYKVFDDAFTQSLNEITEEMEGVTLSTCDGISIEDLIEEGYIEIKQTEGSSLYVFTSDTEYKLVDINNDYFIVVDLTTIVR